MNTIFEEYREFEFDRFVLTTLSGEQYDYEINGLASTDNTKKLGFKFNRENIDLFDSIVEAIKELKKSQIEFREATLYLNKKEELTMSFKYIVGGTNDEFTLALAIYGNVDKLGIELLFKE